MAEDIRFTTSFDDSDIERSIENMLDSVDKTDKAFKDLGKSATDAMNKAADESNKAADSVNNVSQEIGEVIKDQEKATKSAGRNIDKLKKVSDKAFDSIEQKGGQAGSAIANVGRVAGPVGAIVAGVGVAITAAFLDVKSNANAAKRELEGLKAIGNELKDRVFAGIRAIALQFTGDLASASREAATALGAGRDTLAQVRQNGKDFFDLQEQLKKTNRELIVLDAERAAQLGRIRALSSDQNKTLQDRVDLVRQASAIESSLNNSRIAQLQNELIIQRQKSQKLC